MFTGQNVQPIKALFGDRYKMAIFWQEIYREKYHNVVTSQKTKQNKGEHTQRLFFFFDDSFIQYPPCVFAYLSYFSTLINTNLKTGHCSVMTCLCLQFDLRTCFPPMKYDSLLATHYQNYAAPGVTTLLCLLVILLESLICSFVNLFPRWQKIEWSHRPEQASLSTAFRAVRFTKCLFSLWSEEEGLTANCLDTAFVNNLSSLGFPVCFAPSCWCLWAKRLVREPWEQRWHKSQPGFPSNRSRSQLPRTVIGQWDTTWGGCTCTPTFIKWIRCFC